MICGPYKVQERKELYKQAIELRKMGYGYRSIAHKVNISWGTIRNWTKDIDSDPKYAYVLSEELRSKPRIIELHEAKTNRGRRLWLIRKFGHKCFLCHNTEWLDKLIPLELDHINGDKLNNSLENIRLICPNCHAFTSTYKGKNVKRGVV